MVTRSQPLWCPTRTSLTTVCWSDVFGFSDFAVDIADASAHPSAAAAGETPAKPKATSPIPSSPTMFLMRVICDPFTAGSPGYPYDVDSPDSVYRPGEVSELRGQRL